MEQKIGYVYKITSPNNRIYIGSSINVTQRWKSYKKLDCKKQTKIYNSFIKYGVKNHIFEIIWEGPVEEMLKMETLLGRKLNVLSSENLNLCLPKLDDNYTCISEETREKMRKAQTGKKMSKESIEKTRLANIGKIISQERRDRHSQLMKGRKLSKEHIENRTKSQVIAIVQIDLNNNFIREWESSISVQKELGFDRSHIIKCCKNKLKTYKNFKWKYKNERN
jgi:group I intron endonuclease